MNRKSLILLAITGAFALPVAAQAPAPSSGGDSMKPQTSAATPSGFAGLDKNNDGYISRDEALTAPWVSRFAEIDKDNDGRVSRAEFDASQGAARGATTDKKPEKPMK